MDDFYSTILKALLKDGILTREMRILVVCGAVPDKDALRREGFANVTISSLDERYDKQEFAPYVWSFQDAEKLSFGDGEFDFCIAHNGLHHCHSPHRALLEMYRVAKKGVLVFEPRDSLLARFGVYLGFGQEYEVAAVVGNGLKFGGVRNTFMPNYVYRWTEREIEKTVRSFAPWGKHRFLYRYAFRAPWEPLRILGKKSLLVLVRAVLPLLKFLVLLFPKQANGFAFVILKPEIPANLHPWLRLEHEQLQIDKDWLEQRFKLRR